MRARSEPPTRASDGARADAPLPEALGMVAVWVLVAMTAPEEVVADLVVAVEADEPAEVAEVVAEPEPAAMVKSPDSASMPLLFESVPRKRML
jgi:hypothetical protein